MIVNGLFGIIGLQNTCEQFVRNKAASLGNFATKSALKFELIKPYERSHSVVDWCYESVRFRMVHSCKEWSAGFPNKQAWGNHSCWSWKRHFGFALPSLSLKHGVISADIR